MVLVAEVNGLVYRHVDLIDEVNTIYIKHYSQNTGHNEEAGEYAGLRSPVGTAREYLSHIRFSCGFYEGRGLKTSLRSRGILGQITPVNYAGLPPCQQTQRIK